MIARSTIEEVKRVLIEEALTDIVGPWLLLGVVRENAPLLTPDEARQATLKAVREALAEERVVPGEFVDLDEETYAFAPWRLSVDDAMARIEREWTALGREPNPGEIAWFAAPRLLPVTIRKHPVGKDWKPSST
jgi:hypothetical protein